MKKLLSIVALLVSIVAIGQTKKLHLKGSNLQWEAKKVVAKKLEWCRIYLAEDD